MIPTFATPRAVSNAAVYSPWSASDGAVRKYRPFDSTVENCGLVLDGEIIKTFDPVNASSTDSEMPDAAAPTSA